MRIPPARRPGRRVDPDTFPDSSLCSLRSAARFFGLLRNACDDSLSPIILAAQRDGWVFSETKDDRHEATRAHARVDWKNSLPRGNLSDEYLRERARAPTFAAREGGAQRSPRPKGSAQSAGSADRATPRQLVSASVRRAWQSAPCWRPGASSPSLGSAARS